LLIDFRKIASKMKQLHKIHIAFGGLFLVLMAMTACSPERIRPEEALPAVHGSVGNCPTRASIVEGRSHEEYRAYLYALSAADKYCLWKDKLIHSLQFFSDPTQTAFIKAFANSLSVDLFERGNPAGFEEVFVAHALPLFTMDEIARIFLVLHDFDNPPAPLGPNSGGGSSDCTCYWSISCGVLGLCQVQSCPRVYNCGILGNSACTGLCENGGM
jgi:hypothetical protein